MVKVAGEITYVEVLALEACKKLEEAGNTVLPLGEGFSVVRGLERRAVHLVVRTKGVVVAPRRASLEVDANTMGDLLKACGHRWEVSACPNTIHGGNDVM